MLNSFFAFAAICFAFGYSVNCHSQNLTIPKTEFLVSTEDSVGIAIGSFKKLNIWVLRSKSFSKTNAHMGISSSLPEGVLVNFQPQKGHFDYCEATISVNPEAKPGTYLIIVSGTIQYKTKGKVIKLIITEPLPAINQVTVGN